MKCVMMECVIGVLVETETADETTDGCDVGVSNNGPSTEPCGTPQLAKEAGDAEEPTWTTDRYELIH